IQQETRLVNVPLSTAVGRPPRTDGFSLPLDLYRKMKRIKKKLAGLLYEEEKSIFISLCPSLLQKRQGFVNSGT
ncbi:hypothetical protein CSUI_001027, partial [Cystoisospora suis]